MVLISLTALALILVVPVIIYFAYRKVKKQLIADDNGFEDNSYEKRNRAREHQELQEQSKQIIGVSKYFFCG